jgi:hypothetical protein
MDFLGPVPESRVLLKASSASYAAELGLNVIHSLFARRPLFRLANRLLFAAGSPKVTMYARLPPFFWA